MRVSHSIPGVSKKDSKHGPTCEAVLSAHGTEMLSEKVSANQISTSSIFVADQNVTYYPGCCDHLPCLHNLLLVLIVKNLIVFIFTPCIAPPRRRDLRKDSRDLVLAAARGAMTVLKS